MGCCFSKKRKNRTAPGARRCEPEDRDPPSPEEETVKEVLSETPSAKPRPEAKPVPNANAVHDAEERGAEKMKKQEDSADAAVSDLGSCVSLSLATDERSEAASESSAATSSVAGPERSPGRKPSARRRPVSADLGPARRDRAAAASYGIRSRSARGSPSPPPPRHVPRDRSVRRSPSPAAKRPSSEHRRAASPAAPAQRKPPVPARPSGRVSPRRPQEPPPPPASPPPSSPPPSQTEDDDVTAASEHSVPDASAGGEGQRGRDGDGKESLENPLVSLECFIFL
ncbi:serine/arginine repetitive matrix protein 1 [Panicum miliaceum]|uniref:Serine/arginine repetitive matrix protein 1 n=1 Tax=Panicum miliaceum TaxID=4540 RepID=A0A3L6QXU5_PANMI|nr:serine/arginine repetitive matrix protein 1 [Panicum miliaceum]